MISKSFLFITKNKFIADTSSSHLSKISIYSPAKVTKIGYISKISF